MSRISLAARRALVVSGVSALAALSAAAPAQAASAPRPFTKSLTYSCSYPLAGSQPLTIVLDGALSEFPAKLAINAVLTAGGSTSDLAAFTKAATIEGVVGLGTTLSDYDMLFATQIPLTIPQQELPTSGPLTLTAAGAAPVPSFTIGAWVNKLQLELRLRDAQGQSLPVAGPGGAGDIDNDRDNAFDVGCVLAPPTQDTVLLRTTSVIPQPPTRPGKPDVTAISGTGAKVSWLGSTDDVGVVGYDIYNGVTRIASVSGTGTTTTLYGLTPDTTYSLTVVARDAAANVSAASPVTAFTTTCGCVIIDPPLGPVVSEITPTTATVRWAAAGDPSTRYRVFLNAVEVAQTAGLSIKLTGLTPATTYRVQVKSSASDGSGGSIPDPSESPITAFTTPPATPTELSYRYSVAGTATLKTLVKGILPLAGTLDATVSNGTGNVTGALALAPARVKLVVLGFLPVEAKVALESTAPVTGSLTDGVFALNAKVRVKFQTVSLWGTTIAGGGNCQARSISNIALRSVNKPYDPSVGGTLAGTFAISDLVNCGGLTGLISPLTAGKNNAIAVNLSPAG